MDRDLLAASVPSSSRLLAAFCFLICLWCSQTTLHAQNTSLAGVIRDESNAVLAKASVNLVNDETGQGWTTVSDADGLFSFVELPPGHYRLVTTAQGFQPQTLENIQLLVGGKSDLNITMHIGNTQEVVKVEASALEINSTDAAVSAAIDEKVVRSMPLNGRSFQSLLTLIPGVTVQVSSQGAGISGDMSVNGQRTESNYYTVDGVSATTGLAIGTQGVGYGASFGGGVANTSTLGTTQNIVSVDALQEFRANTSTYSAEYGRGSGGQFSFLTKSGTNKWHGLAYDYFRNGDMDANNWFNNHTVPETPRQPERQNDFGGTFSGPIRLGSLYNGVDHSFFFFAYEGLRLASPYAAASYTVPDLTTRASAIAQEQPFLNAFPVPNGASLGDGLAYFTGGYTAISSLDSYSIRFDHSLNSKLQLFARYGFVRSSSGNNDSAHGNLAVIYNYGNTTQPITVGATSTLTPHLINEFRANYTKSDASQTTQFTTYGGATIPDMANVVPGWSRNFTFTFKPSYDLGDAINLNPAWATQHQVNLVDSLSWTKGKHEFKFGVDWRRLITIESTPDREEYGTFANTSQLVSDMPNSNFNIRRSLAPWIEPIYYNFSAYAQDEYKVTPRLNLSLGIRWDVNPAPHDADGNNPYTTNQITNLQTLAVAPKNTPLWNTSWDNFAPRVGFAYRLFLGSRLTVVRGGFGVFYGTGNERGSLGYNDVGWKNSVFYTNQLYPATTAQLNIAAPNTNTPYQYQVVGFDRNLLAPATYEWNLAIEQSISPNQTFSVTGVGAAGRNLTAERYYSPISVGNTAFSNAYVNFYAINNSSTSDYDALQLMYRDDLSHGLHAIGAYVWSHSFDDVSNNFLVYVQERASSDYDIRQSLQAAVTYDAPLVSLPSIASALVNHWGLDLRQTIVTASPVDILTSSSVQVGTGQEVSFHPNIVPGQPFYLSGSYPGGRRINSAAFSKATSGGVSVEGNLPRNYLRGFGSENTDLALRREFPINEQVGLTFRAEAFNIFNHPQFGAIYTTYPGTATTFGLAYNTRNIQLGSLNPLYQTGGPRSLQVALRLHF